MLTNKERKAEFMVWQLEVQIAAMKGTLDYYRGKEEYLLEDRNKLEHGYERETISAHYTGAKTQADYIEFTIKELEGILEQYKAEDEEEEEELEEISGEDLLEWQFGNDYHKFVK